MSPLIFIPKLPTLATGLYVYESLNSRKIDEMNMPIYFSGIVICMLPVLMLFLVFQNTIMEISMSGGVKE
jgi:ABC-type glycerol-3-phosphate transport system permease component